MGLIVRFILASVVASVVLAGGSLIWPRITVNPRPKLLEDVKNIVIKTPSGQRAAYVLGVSDEARAVPINIGSVVSYGVESVKGALQQRMQTIIVGNAVNQLNQQFDKLQPEQKKQIQDIICNPANPNP
jgi:hypothetical protein